VNRIFHSFYARLSAIFLLLILGLGATSVIIAFNASGHLFDEVEQLLNRDYAESIALEIQPIVQAGFQTDDIAEAIHYMMVLNPMVEIYLLDGAGEIKAYFTHPEERIVRREIDVSPLEEFVESNGRKLILGEDPRTPDERKPFSAARLSMGEEEGFVYVILRGQGYDRSLEELRSSYYLQTGFTTFMIALLLTLIVGFSLFFLVTRRLRFLSLAVRAFERGELDYRVEIQGSDELGSLGRAFNDMAASVESGLEALRRAEEQRKELIANISHDLKSPLTSIRGHLETVLLKGARLTDAKQREYLETALKNVSGFQRLVEELFDLVRLENRQIEPSMEPFSVAELVQDVVLKHQPQAARRGVTLEAVLPDGLPRVEADIGMIERVLTNLIENALRYTGDGGMVKLGLYGENEAVRVTVTDNGAGISPEDLPHIFERFYRADKSRDRTVSGTGLGLAIAQEIINLHGGTITAESTPGEGARFYFNLKIATS
jgi:signal transduction histidine kinase